MTNFETLYNMLVCGNITEYKNRLKRIKKQTLVNYILWAIDNNISIYNLRLDFISR